MTREQKIERARELRIGGKTYDQIVERLGVSSATAYRWLNPEYAARHRVTARAWKARNPERTSTYNKRYMLDDSTRARCPKCGGPIRGNSRGARTRRYVQCGRCRREEAA